MEKRLTADLNVVANSNLEIQLLDGDLNIIQKLDDEPNDVGGLTSAELKAKFDESGNIIKKYINETLIPAVLTDDATEESRKQAEAARVAAEQGRVTAEEGRVSAETARAAAEQARSEAESSRVSAENAREAAETARADETAGIVARATAQANAAAGSASQAAGSEQSAKDAAGTATGAANSASQSAAAASGSASQASAAAAAAAQSAANGETANKSAQSWAVGGTGTRPGEDTNNAKYWAEHAEAVAGGDFATKVEAQGYVTAHNESKNAHHDLRVAVAGSIRYDAAQSLTDAQKVQARGNINAAPGGFGFGGEPIKTVSATSKDETYESFCARLDEVMSEMPNNSVKLLHVYPPQIYGKSSSTCSIVFQHTDGYCGVYNIGMPDPTCSQWRMIKVAGVWQPFEWINPPMELDTEYRTTERYLGKPVYTKIKQFDNLSTSQMYSPGGSIIRFSGETQWPYDDSGRWVPQIVSRLPKEELKGDFPSIDFGANYNFTIRILLTTNSKSLGKSARVQMWYTK
jgi:hypothetical protein